MNLRRHEMINESGYKKKHVHLSDFTSTKHWVVLPLQIPKEHSNKTIWEEKFALGFSFKKSVPTGGSQLSELKSYTSNIVKYKLVEECWQLLLPAGRLLVVWEAPAAEMIIRLGRLTPGYFRLLQVGHNRSDHKSIISCLYVSFDCSPRFILSHREMCCISMMKTF